MTTIVTVIKNKLALRSKNRELKRLQHWRWSLVDQVVSGQKGIERCDLHIRKLEMEIDALTPADEVIDNLIRGTT